MSQAAAVLESPSQRAGAPERIAGAAFVLFLITLPGPIAPMSVAAVLCLSLTVTAWLAGARPAWVRTPVQWPALGWLAALVLAVAFAVGGPSSPARVMKGFMPIAVVVAAWHARRREAGTRALAVLFAAGALAAAIGFVSWLAGGATLGSRAHGVTGHYMTFAGQQLLILSVAAGVAFTTTDRRWRLGAGATLAIGLLGLGASMTRSSWIGFAVALVVVLVPRRPTSPHWIWAGLAVVGLGGLAVALGPAVVRARLASIVDPHHPWNQQRLYMWQAGLRMFHDHPLTGVGLQDLHVLYDRYRSPAATEPAGHLHNVVVQIAATMGVIGLAAFAWLYGSLFAAAGSGLRAMLPQRTVAAGVRLGVAAALAGFLAAGMFEWNFGDEELLYLLYALVGLAWAAKSWDER